MASARDQHTGRYIHEWGYVGADPERGEISECQVCGRVRTEANVVRTYKDRAAAAKAGVTGWLPGYAPGAEGVK